jgi:branched-chain amino acid transport system permease protein
VIFGFIPEVLRSMAIKPEAQWIIYGVLMILVVYFLPQGIVPAVRRVLASRRAALASPMLKQPQAQGK